MPPSSILFSLFDKLDLRTPEDLLIAFHIAEHWPATPPLEDAESNRRLEIIERYAPHIFGNLSNDFSEAFTRECVTSFLDELGGEEHQRDNIYWPCAPREWLHVFREAAQQGIIQPIAYGVAFRFFVIRTAGNGTPGYPADSLAARAEMLNGLRNASPQGLMDTDEQQIWASLPDQITLWRGGRGNFGQLPIDRARALHWAPDRAYAEIYMRGRGAQRTMATLVKFPASVGVAVAAGDQNSPALIFHAHRLRRELGQPYLLQASVPKEFVFAYIAAGAEGKQVELLVDFEQLTAEMIEDVTPEGYRWAA